MRLATSALFKSRLVSLLLIYFMRLTPVLPPLILHFYSIENNLLESEKAAVKELILGGDAIAQWICLRLPSCHPGFESQAHL